MAFKLAGGAHKWSSHGPHAHPNTRTKVRVYLYGFTGVRFYLYGASACEACGNAKTRTRFYLLPRVKDIGHTIWKPRSLIHEPLYPRRPRHCPSRSVDASHNKSVCRYTKRHSKGPRKSAINNRQLELVQRSIFRCRICNKVEFCEISNLLPLISPDRKRNSPPAIRIPHREDDSS